MIGAPGVSGEEHRGALQVAHTFATKMESVLPMIYMSGRTTSPLCERMIIMLHPKACPRCSGDLSLVQDIGDTYYSCLQCGFVTYRLPEARPQLVAQARHN